MKTQQPVHTITEERAGKNISVLHWILGMYLKETAGIARYKIQVLMVLWASRGINPARRNIIPAMMLKAMMAKLTKS